MNNIYVKVFLSIIVVFIWGAVINKFFFSQKNLLTANQNIVEMPTIKPKKKKKYELNLINRNPFGENYSFKKKEKSSQKEKINKILSTKISPAENIKAVVKYFGYVKSNTANHKVVLFSIDNKLFKVKEKSSVKKIKIIKAYSDSLIINNRGKKQTIKKNK